MGDLPAAFRVADKQRETADTWTLRLEPADAAADAPRFSPGQFAMLYAFGIGEAPISVSGDLHGGELAHTVRAVGAVTAAICAAEPGDVSGARAVRDRLADRRRRGPRRGGRGRRHRPGTAAAGRARRARAPRPLRARDGRLRRPLPREPPLHERARAWRGRFDVDVDVIVDVAGPDWRGRVGVVTRLIPRATFDREHAVAMVCGPEVMMRFTALALQERGVSRRAIRLSMERSMKCAIGHCGHCQLRPLFICKDGPVFRRDVVEPLMRVAEL